MYRGQKPEGVIHFTTGNSKLEYTGRKNGCFVYAFGLPSMITCPYKGVCQNYCYASYGRYTFPNVMDRVSDNLAFSRSPSFVEEAVKEINIIQRESKDIPVVIRLHDSGDFYSEEYIRSWYSIMSQTPDVRYYAYTKSFPLIESIEDIPRPKNFNYIPSKGGKMDSLLSNRPSAFVVPEGTVEYDLAPECVIGSQDDLENLRQYLSGKSIALVAHGVKKRSVKHA
jgi:hypothetical protein